MRWPQYACIAVMIAFGLMSWYIDHLRSEAEVDALLLTTEKQRATAAETTVAEQAALILKLQALTEKHKKEAEAYEKNLPHRNYFNGRP